MQKALKILIEMETVADPFKLISDLLNHPLFLKKKLENGS